MAILNLNYFADKKAVRGASWSNQEIAEFYRVEAALNATGLRVVSESGLSDEGDPWFVFCRNDDEVIVHITRSEGLYRLFSPVLSGHLVGASFRTLLAQFINDIPVTQKLKSNVVVHPSAMLSIVVATLLLAFDGLNISEADAAETIKHFRAEGHDQALHMSFDTEALSFEGQSSTSDRRVFLIREAEALIAASQVTAIVTALAVVQAKLFELEKSEVDIVYVYKKSGPVYHFEYAEAGDLSVSASRHGEVLTNNIERDVLSATFEQRQETHFITTSFQIIFDDLQKFGVSSDMMGRANVELQESKLSNGGAIEHKSHDNLGVDLRLTLQMASDVHRIHVDPSVTFHSEAELARIGFEKNSNLILSKNIEPSIFEQFTERNLTKFGWNIESSPLRAIAQISSLFVKIANADSSALPSHQDALLGLKTDLIDRYSDFRDLTSKNNVDQKSESESVAQYSIDKTKNLNVEDSSKIVTTDGSSQQVSAIHKDFIFSLDEIQSLDLIWKFVKPLSSSNLTLSSLDRIEGFFEAAKQGFTRVVDHDDILFVDNNFSLKHDGAIEVQKYGLFSGPSITLVGFHEDVIAQHI